jgi:CRP/FNR family cyclic AMP-dependent transcriptional regulator
MPWEHLAVLSQAASDVTVPARHRFFEDGGHATRFWLVQSGHATWTFMFPGRAGYRSTPSEWVG